MVLDTNTAPTTHVPEWETPSVDPKKENHGFAGTLNKTTFTGFIDRILPPHKKYLGLRRNPFILIIILGLLALLALIIGLAVGLTKHNQYFSSCAPNLS
jgi:hypothetical protein